MSIRPATANDIETVLRVQEASPGAARWRRNDYERLVGESERVFRVTQAGSIVGFLAARLLREALSEVRNQSARSAWLEVRDSNQRARAFYRSFGFRETHRQARFYQNPEEDAVVCRRTLKPLSSA
ncbi:MAG: GNAT family N-acetyltransferase [Terriglobia bacterium]